MVFNAYPSRILNLLHLTCLGIMCSLPLTAVAGKYNRDIDIGDKAPAWKDLPGIDDKTHSLSDLKKTSVIVVVFTCNSCPYALDYESRIMQLSKRFADDPQVELIAINVNNVEEDRLPAMKKRAKEQSFNFTYLYDESQQIAREFGATTTPECFVLNQNREIVYMGALDDSTDITKVKQNYVQTAIDSIKAGKTPKVTETVPIGCRIRYERTRRRARKKKIAQ